MARKPACPGPVAPAQREHVANSFDDDGLVPAVLQTFLKEDQIPDADLLPLRGSLGDDPGGRDPAALPLAPLAGGAGGWARLPLPAAASSLS